MYEQVKMMTQCLQDIRTNKLVNFKGSKEAIGKLVKVKITEGRTWHLLEKKLMNEIDKNLMS